MLVYPNIGCLKDDITNYTITVSYIIHAPYIPHLMYAYISQVGYQYTPCTGSTQPGSMTLPDANGSLFNITGLGSYTL